MYDLIVPKQDILNLFEQVLTEFENKTPKNEICDTLGLDPLDVVSIGELLFQLGLVERL